MPKHQAPHTNPSLLGRLRAVPVDQQAWVGFVDRYGPSIHAWCLEWRLVPDDAAEVTQQVLTRLVVRLRSFEYDPAQSFRNRVRDRVGARPRGLRVVYAAREVALSRPVAIKVFPPLVGRADARDRFEREATAVAGLHHPHVVQVYRVGEADGRPYLVMEYAEGASLADRTADAPWPALRAAEAVCTLAQTVDYAHRRGIVHRDLKPGNVLLVEGGVLKVADFGLAITRQLGLGGSAGFAVGTPGYAAPELLAGGDAGGAESSAVDVYSLGAILYELLTGRPPFRAARPLDTVYQTIHQPPIPPSRLEPRTPRDLEVICLKCLEKSPAQRYATAGQLADDLRWFLTGGSILARPCSPVEQAGRWAKRHPGSAAGLALIASLAIGDEWRYDAGTVLGVQWGRDGNAVAVWGKDGVRIWDAGGRLLGHVLAAATVSAVTSLDDGGWAAATADGRWCVWDRPTRRERFAPRRLKAVVRTLGASPDGGHLFLGLADGSVARCRPDTGEVVEAVDAAVRPVAQGTVAGSGTVAVLAGDEQVQLFRLADTLSVSHLLKPRLPIAALALSDDGRHLAGYLQPSAAPAGQLLLWDTTTGLRENTIVCDGPLTDLRFSRDGDRFVAGGASRRASV